MERFYVRTFFKRNMDAFRSGLVDAYLFMKRDLATAVVECWGVDARVTSHNVLPQLPPPTGLHNLPLPLSHYPWYPWSIHLSMVHGHAVVEYTLTLSYQSYRITSTFSYSCIVVSFLEHLFQE